MIKLFTTVIILCLGFLPQTAIASASADEQTQVPRPAAKVKEEVKVPKPSGKNRKSSKNKNDKKNVKGTKDFKTSITPRSLHQGSKIAIITPSSSTDSMKVVHAMQNLAAMGYVPVPMSHVFGHRHGSYTAPDTARAADIMRAFTDPEIDAILCTRGGYGATRLLPLLDMDEIRANPKWLIGFSDITALHAYLWHAGILSIHGPMCGHIAANPYDIESKYLMDILTKGLPLTYKFPPHGYNKTGKAHGRLVGGNFIVANNLADTPYDVFSAAENEDVIIFVEEVGEQIYAVERMLLRLHQAGVLDKVQGLIFGEFTEYGGDSDFRNMEEMIHSRLEEWGYYDKKNLPILYNFPAGHGHPNYPLIMGAKTTLNITSSGTTVTQGE